MSTELDGTTYLNATESADYLDVSFVTFQKVREAYKLQSYKRPGKLEVLYKKEDLEKLRAPQPIVL